MSEQDTDQVVNNEVEAVSTEAESTPTEKQDTEGSEAPEYKTILGDDGELKQVKVSESEDDEDEDDPDEQDRIPKKGAEARKDQLAAEMDQRNEEIRQMVAQKNQMIAQQQQMQQELQRLQAAQAGGQNAQQIPTVEQLMQQENPQTGDYFTQFEAQAVVENLELRQQVEQINQQRQVEQYNSQVAASINGMTMDAERALQEFPMFDEESSEFNPQLAADAAAIVESGLIYDKSGRVIGSNTPIYQVYKTLSNAAKAGGSSRRQSTNQMRAGADFMGSGQKSSKKFDDLTSDQMEARLRKKGLIQ